MSGWLPPGVTDADIDNAAPQNEDDAPRTKEEWRAHNLAMDEQAIIGGVEGMLAAGARAELMDLINDIISEYRLDRFVGRIDRDEMDYETCAVCAEPLKTKRDDAIYCSTACRMVAYRRRAAKE
jgi:hypothetical protein